MIFRLKSTIIPINLTKSAWISRQYHPIKQAGGKRDDGILLAEKVKKEEGVQPKLDI